MPYYRQSLDDYDGTVKPSLLKLMGLRPMVGGVVTTVMRGQDRIAPSGRRVVARWSTGDTTTMDWKGEVTPGCFLVVSALAEPSAGATAIVTGDVTYYARSGADATVTVAVPPVFGAAISSAAGRSFLTAKQQQQVLLPGGLVSTTELSRFCQHLTAEVDIAINGTYCKDVILYELPVDLALQHSDASDQWVSHVISLGGLENPAPKLLYPVDALNDTNDPRGGSTMLQEVASAQRLRLGPHLIHWSGSFDAPSSLACIHNSSIAAWDGAQEGYSLGCGGYARNWVDNSNFVLRNRVSSIPVRINALVTVAGAGGVVRVQSALDSWVEVSCASTGWHTQTGYLEVGANCDDFVVGQLFARDDGTDFIVLAVDVYYGHQAASG